MENGLMTPLIVALACLGCYFTIYLSIFLNLGIFTWLAIVLYLSPYGVKLAIENKLRWKRHIESYEPANLDWEKSLREYIAQNLKK